MEESKKSECRPLRGTIYKLLPLVLIVVAVAAVGLAGPLVLRLFAEILICEDQIDLPARGRVWIVLTANHRRVPETYTFVAALASRVNATKVLIFFRPATRVEELGIVPRSAELARDQLQKEIPRGQPVEIVPIDCLDFWDEVRALKRLKADPDTSLVVCVPRFGTSAARVILTRLSLRDQHRKVFLCGVPDPRYDESTWWRTRSGWKALFWAYSDLFSVWLFGEPQKFLPLSVESYEAWAEEGLFRRGGKWAAIVHRQEGLEGVYKGVIEGEL